MSNYRSNCGGLSLAVVCLWAVGCVSPYTYHPDGNCGPMSLSGRFAADGTCAACSSAVISPESAAGPGEMLRRTFTCGSGCGEIYWGEWINDPPSCDACNDHGDWTGTACCPPSRWERLVAGIHGQQNGPKGNCAECEGMESGDSSGGIQIDGLTIDVPPADFGPLPPPAANTEAAPAAPAQIAAQPDEPHPLSRLKRRVRR